MIVPLDAEQEGLTEVKLELIGSGWLSFTIQ